MCQKIPLQCRQVDLDFFMRALTVNQLFLLGLPLTGVNADIKYEKYCTSFAVWLASLLI